VDELNRRGSRLGIGKPIAYGASGVGKRLRALGRLWPLRGGRLLDIGCGNGAYTLELAAGFDEVHGIEIEPERLGELERRLAAPGAPANVRAALMSAEALEFPDASFDVVTAIEVIEHIVDLDRALDEVRRVLRPGGAFLITCPNRWFPFELHSFVLPWPGGRRSFPGRWFPLLPYLPPLHRRIATARNFASGELRRRMAAHGLEQVGVDYVMPPFDGGALGRRFIRPVTERLERTPLKVLGVSIAGAYRRPA
jgi:SAM-dependent methyltransferase